MLPLFQKEINAFFSAITGYVVIIVFLGINAAVMWIFSNNLNILDLEYANLDSLFLLAPWIFLFLVPAITMRVFA
ncbi:MAG: gliding motility-associated ABC transporter permease subunit GldF, partial [Bacteroidales bacterium]|nr:gliding motility-associated ABC transporter permease subunit GldF [Bacteroidales bacterium]